MSFLDRHPQILVKEPIYNDLRVETFMAARDVVLENVVSYVGWSLTKKYEFNHLNVKVKFVVKNN